MSSVEFWGGIGEYGRACYYFSVKDISLLFDCGINKDTGKIPDLIPKKATQLDYVFLSHSHKDHSWAIPHLYKEGYSKQIFMNRETAHQLHDFFGTYPNINVSILEEKVGPCKWYRLNPNMSIAWGSSGHMPGALWYIVDVYGKRIFYTGDYNGDSKILPHHDPAVFLKNECIDIAIIDCAYGIENISYDYCINQILNKVEEAINNDGNVLFPSHIYGKSIELYILLKQKFEKDQFIIIKKFYEAINKFINNDYRNRFAMNKHFLENNIVINDINDCKDCFKLNNSPKIIFTGNLCNSNRIALYCFKELKNLRKNKIIFLSREPKESIGRWALMHSKELKADISSMKIKSHQGIREVKMLLDNMSIKKVILCHGNRKETMIANERLQKAGYYNVIDTNIPKTIRF